MREFAESEIVLPNGPRRGRRFRVIDQPYSGLVFSEIDSQRWARHVFTGPSQSGKTLTCFAIPTLYHLFEVGETVICGLPDMDMAADKWFQDLKPVIECSRYRDLLPMAGGGSRGGKVESITFRNGVTLKFMSGGGSDKSRAGYTARVLVVTETDGLDESGGASREADKLTQLEARTRAFGERRVIYLECTVSIETGRTWTEYTSGSHSRIVLPCPHCRAYVTPEREHLVGWQDADSEEAARQATAFYCPGCGESWSDAQRVEANVAAKLIHRGQSIDRLGRIRGQLPPTRTLGFRWSACNNLFASAAQLGAEEWRSSRSDNRDNAEREQRQFIWALPYVPEIEIETPLRVHDLAARTAPPARGRLPDNSRWLVFAADLGKYRGHWAAVAWIDEGDGRSFRELRGQVVDYGIFEIPSSQLPADQAILLALRELRDEIVMAGWLDGETPRIPDLALIDAGYKNSAVFEFTRESGEPWLPAIGRGASQRQSEKYVQPKQLNKSILWLGEHMHLGFLPKDRIRQLIVDSDYWKTQVQERLACPAAAAGALTFFEAPPRDHLDFADHLTAERSLQEFLVGRGMVTRWERVKRNNHWLDCLYNCCAAGRECDQRGRGLNRPAPAKPAKTKHAEPFVRRPSREKRAGGFIRRRR